MMADPINEIQAINAAERSPLQARPPEVPNEDQSNRTSEEAVERIAATKEGEEAQDLGAATTREKMEQLMAQWPPVRITFRIDRETRDVRIRVVNPKTGEIIRVIPPDESLKVEREANQPQ